MNVQFGFIYTYGIELFPTNVRSFAISLATMISLTLSGVSTYIITFMKWINFNPMGSLLVIGILPFICSNMLPETKNKKMKN